MARTGRPKVQIDWDQVEKLCVIACTGEEIADFIGIDYDTLVTAIKRKFKKTFSEYFAQKSVKGTASLRRRQFEAAMAGDRTMMIWLGKQRLGQSEKVTSINKTELEATVTTIDREELRKANEELESEC
jgi:hypothetical protein